MLPRLALAAYRMQQTIQIEGCLRNWPLAQLVLFVDDSTDTASAAAVVAAMVVAEVVYFTVLRFQQHLLL